LSDEKIGNFNHLRGVSLVGNAQISRAPQLPHRTLERPIGGAG
jgi:hypothetical protein